MSFLRRQASCPSSEKNRNIVIREKINIKVLGYIGHEQLNWFGHVQRMNKQSYLERRKGKGRFRNSWMQEVTTEIREKRINYMERIDIENGEGK